jgi:hypothetical protein
VGHRRNLIAVGVLLGRVHKWLLTEIDEHLRERAPPFPLTLRSSGSCPPGIGNGSDGRKHWNTATGPDDRRHESMVTRFTGMTRYPMMFRGSSRSLYGGRTSKPNRGRLSVCKGTREARPSRVIARPGQLMPQVSPMRRTSGGAAVVVGGRESRPQGEGRQDVSFWTAERFTSWEGSQ